MAAPYGTTVDFGQVTTGAYQWNQGVRAISMHPFLVHLSPTATVTLSSLGEVTSDSVSPEWMQVTLGSIDTSNAVAESADYTYTDENVPARVQQLMQHMRKTAQVSGRMMKDKTFRAIRNVKNQQIDVRMRELKRDMNYALINSQLTSGTISPSVGTTFRGILSSIDAGGTGAGGAGNNVDAQGGLAESHIKAMLKRMYVDGFEPTDLYVGSTVQELIDLFGGGTTLEASGSVTKFIDVTSKEMVSHISTYDTPWGRVQIHLERDIYFGGSVATADTGNVCFALDRQYWKTMYFRRTWMEEPPKDGDRWRGVIQVDWGVQDLAGNSGSSLTNTA